MKKLRRKIILRSFLWIELSSKEKKIEFFFGINYNVININTYLHKKRNKVKKIKILMINSTNY